MQLYPPAMPKSGATTAPKNQRRFSAELVGAFAGGALVLPETAKEKPQRAAFLDPVLLSGCARFSWAKVRRARRALPR